MAELKEVNSTLRRYLEEVISKMIPQKSAEIIKSEAERLSHSKQLALLGDNN